jgi:hypothetical protein
LFNNITQNLFKAHLPWTAQFKGLACSGRVIENSTDGRCDIANIDRLEFGLAAADQGQCRREAG